MRDVFADTSALYALLDRGDRHHAVAKAAFEGLDPDETTLVTSSYVVLETLALLQSRIGMEPVRRWRAEFGSIVEVVWVDAGLHERALGAFIAAGRRSVSLTDWASFEIMRERAIDEVFCFDSDFTNQGFRALP